MAPAAMNDKHVPEHSTRINDRTIRVRVGRVTFNVGRHVRNSKEKVKFAKGSKELY